MAIKLGFELNLIRAWPDFHNVQASSPIHELEWFFYLKKNNHYYIYTYVYKLLLVN